MTADRSPAQDTRQITFEELRNQCYQRVTDFCIRLLSDREEAQDVTQEAFTRAYQRLDSFRGDHSLCGWVVTIAKNICLEWLHTKKNQENRNALRLDDPDNLAVVNVSNPQTSVEQSVTDRLYVERLQTRLWEIGQSAKPAWDTDDWQIFIYRYEQDMSYPEIARRLNRPESTIKDRVRHRIQLGIEQVRREMQAGSLTDETAK